MRFENAAYRRHANPTGDGNTISSRPRSRELSTSQGRGTIRDSPIQFRLSSTSLEGKGNTNLIKLIQFNPRGEPVVKGGATQIRAVHRSRASTHSRNGCPGRHYLIHIRKSRRGPVTGFGGNVRIYRR